MIGSDSDSKSSWVSISSGELSAQIDPQGAQLSSLTDHSGCDLQWNGDPAVWAGRAPLLFPIVGVLAGGGYRLGDTIYHLARHGFARGKKFDIGSITASTATFILTADRSTLDVYPFRFELEVRFELMGATLALTTLIRNNGDVPMPASFGYHPAFRWPLPYGEPRASHTIEFDCDEPAPCRRIDSAGLLLPQVYSTPIVGRRLALADALFEKDAVIFDRLASRSVTYGGAHGPRIRVSFPNTPFLGIWSKPGAGFICIEPWHGITDSVGFAGDFREKRGIFIIAPGSAFATSVTMTLIAG